MKYVCGDIHGSGEELRELVKIIKTDDKDAQINLVGDCFDRAMAADTVWRLIQDNGMLVTIGNHEEKMRKWLRGERRAGLPPHYHYAFDLLFPLVGEDKFLDWLESLPLIIKLNDKCLMTHGGVNLENPWLEDVSANIYCHLMPGVPVPAPDGTIDGYVPVKHRMIGRGKPKIDEEPIQFWWDHYLHEPSEAFPTVCYGHVVTGPDSQPRKRFSASGSLISIGLDTFTCHGGAATAYCCETGQVYQYRSGIDWKSRLNQKLGVKKR